MLHPDTKTHALTTLPQKDDARGLYFPDAIVAPFVAQTIRHQNESLPKTDFAEPCFTLEQSKALIIDAFTEFSPALGAKATEIFQTAKFNERPAQDFRDPSYTLDIEEGSRWNLRQVPEGGKGTLMRSLPAKSAQSEFNPANPNNHAVIEFEFDGSMSSLVYMAHEVGHAAADDNIVKPEGYTYGDNKDPSHMEETQAYLPQHVMYDYLFRHPDKDVAGAAREHFASTMKENLDIVLAAKHAMDSNDAARDALVERMHGRPMSILSAFAIFNHVKDKDGAQRTWALDNLHGKYGAKDIGQVFAAVGIEHEDEMHRLAKSTVERANGLNVAQAATTPHHDWKRQ